MKRVCHITTDHKGNDIRIFQKECISLSQNGYEVFLIQKDFSGEVNGIHMVKYERLTKSKGLLWFLRYRDAYLKALDLNCDLYHFHDPSFFYYAKRLKKKGKTVIYDCHEARYSDISADYSRKKGKIWDLLGKRYDIYERYIAQMMNAVITVTPQMEKYISHYNSKVICLTNFPQKKGFVEIKENRIPGQLIYAGGIMSLWNHEFILEAIAKMEGVKYVLCGKDKPGYLEVLKAQPGWDRVEYCGVLSHEEVSVKLQSSSIGMALSSYRRNTFGKEGTLGNTKIFEEMQAGLPVICTDYDIWKEIVEKNQCGICVNPYSVDEIRSAIQYLLDHPNEAAEMGRRGKEVVENTYNWENEEPKLLSLYTDLTKQKTFSGAD